MLTDKRQVQDAKEELLGDPDLTELLAESKVSEGRSINELKQLVDPGDQVKHPYYLQPWFRISAIGIPLVIMGVIGYRIWGPKPSPVLELGDKDRQIVALTEKLQNTEIERDKLTRNNMSLTQAADLESFNQSSKSKQKPKAKAAKPKPPAQPVRKPVPPPNVVKVPPRVAPVPKPPVSRAPAKAPSPSVSECVGYIERGVTVPGCAHHQITSAKQSPSPPVATSPKPVPVASAPKPIKLAYAKPKTKAKAKPSYKVNYMAGEIQTVDQYEEEFYGSGKTAKASQLSPMQAKVVDHVEWLSPEDAQQVIIPLEITSGPQKGQMAEAQITQMNGLQFTAQVVTLNGQEVEPGTLELRRKNTKYLRADIKRQGGDNFGKKLLGTVTAIGGDIASDQLANVRGGNHISRLLPGQPGSQAVTQFWRFDGDVEIVPVG